METQNYTKYFIYGFIGIMIIWCFASYNSLVGKEVAVEQQFANLDSVYQRRMDLAEQLIPGINAVFKQEGRENVFAEVAAARSQYRAATNMDEKVAAASSFDQGYGRMLIAIESYPQLKASTLVSDLNVQIEGSENRVGTERNRYNEAVAAYSLSLRTFPSSIIASIFGFKSHEMFKADESAKKAPTIKINE